MRHLRALLVPLVLVAGCAAEPAAPPLPADSLRAGFPTGGLADVIRIDAVYRLPLRSAELIAPDGEIIPASSVDIADSPRFATGQSTANDPWKTGIADPIGGGASALGSVLPGNGLRSQVQVLTMVSTAAIPLPDPNAYRTDWQQYRIRLGFGVPPGQVETRDIPAPEPPPPAPAP
jgi:hypothetical protein